MPTYDYVCLKCKQTQELFLTMSEAKSELSDGAHSCKSCGHKILVKQIGGSPTVVYKGSGFYSTDYKSATTKGAKDV